MIVALLALSTAGLYVFAQQVAGEIFDHWLSSNVWPGVLMLTIVCAAAFWTGYRVSLNSSNLFLIVVAGAMLPIIGVVFFGVFGWIETGQSLFDDLSEPAAVSRLGVAVLSSSVFSIVGKACNRKQTI